MKILIVDDDKHICFLFSKILEKIATCDVCDNGEDAVAVFTAALDGGEPYDAVLLDIMMPIMNGQEALRRMRSAEASRGVEFHDQCRIIMLTAMADADNMVEAYFTGDASGYLVKPVSQHDLINELLSPPTPNQLIADNGAA